LANIDVLEMAPEIKGVAEAINDADVAFPQRKIALADFAATDWRNRSLGRMLRLQMWVHLQGSIGTTLFRTWRINWRLPISALLNPNGLPAGRMTCSIQLFHMDRFKRHPCVGKKFLAQRSIY